MDITIPIALLLIVVSTLYFYVKRAYSYWERRGFAYIKPSIPYGNIDSDEPIDLIIHELYKKLKGKGSITGLYLFHQPFGLLMDLDIIKRVTIKDFSYFQDRGLYYNERDDPLSAHLLSVTGEKWRNLRHKLTPTFTTGKMKFMFPTVINVANEFDSCLSDIIESSGGGIDMEIRELLLRFTTDTIGTCAFGIDCNSLRNPEAEFRVMGRKAVEEQKYSPTLLFLISANQRLCNWLRVTITMDDVTKFFMDIVRETVDYRQKNNVKRNDFLDILIEQKNSESGSLTLNEIAAQVFLFFAAGFETSATTMTFAMHELMIRPDIQERAREEITAVLARHNGKLTYEAMGEMPYLDQVINGKLEIVYFYFPI